MSESWKKLRLECDNEGCSGEWNPKTDSTRPYRMAYVGRRFWAHGFKCPGCGHSVWLQSEPWSASPYDRSPIQSWGFFAYTFVVSFLALLVGIVVHQFSGEAGFNIQVIATVGVFVGGIGLVRKDILAVTEEKKASYDKRLLVPLFASAVLLPLLFLVVDAELVLLWGVPGSIVIGYLVGSVWETRFS